MPASTANASAPASFAEVFDVDLILDGEHILTIDFNESVFSASARKHAADDAVAYLNKQTRAIVTALKRKLGASKNPPVLDILAGQQCVKEGITAETAASILFHRPWMSGTGPPHLSQPAGSENWRVDFRRSKAAAASQPKSGSRIRGPSATKFEVRC